MEKMTCRQGMADTPQVWIYYKESGRGTPILMLHGNAETHLIFDYYEKKLSMKYRVILMDSRAHGRSRIKPETRNQSSLPQIWRGTQQRFWITFISRPVSFWDSAMEQISPWNSHPCFRIGLVP